MKRSVLQHRPIEGVVAVVVASTLLMVSACAATTPHATPSNTPRPVPVAVTPPPPASADQAITVARAIFAQAFDGGYLECDAIAQKAFDLSNCPFSSRLIAQVQKYQANQQRLCPQGCGGSLLVIRDQCGSFPSEQVTAASPPNVARVNLSGDTTCRGVGKVFYVSVVIENDQPVADDIQCNVQDPRFGMYNAAANATGAPACPSV